MNIKYTFKSQQNLTDPILDVSIFSEASGNLYPGTSRDDFSRNLHLIQDRINAIQKELSYWDLYKITSKVTSPEELDSVYNDLIIGQSLVIECESFTSNNGDSLHRGDVIVKLSSGDAALIYAVNGGHYFPSATVTAGQLEIDYIYEEGEPEAQSTSYLIPFATSSDSFIYGIATELPASAQTYKFTAYHFPASASTFVYPVIKLFNRTGSNNNYQLEEIVISGDLSIHSTIGGEWHINFNDDKPSILNFIQVK